MTQTPALPSLKSARMFWLLWDDEVGVGLSLATLRVPQQARMRVVLSMRATALELAR